jgi:HD-like signal output (HDOD) protein
MVGLYSVATVKPVDAGETILREGDPPRSLYGILTGSIELRASVNGLASHVAVLGAGECVGSVSATPGEPLPYGAVALEPCSVLEITPAAFNYLEPVVRCALYKWMVSVNQANLNRLIARHAGVSARRDRLVSFVHEAGRRSAALLSSRAFRDVFDGIPKLPVYATDLVTRLLDDKTNADDVVESIKNDPALAGMVLKTVNSAAYGLATKISDYYHALLHLGTIAVYQLVLSSGIDSIMPQTTESQQIGARSHLIALVSSEIARLTSAVRPQLAATIGLLHDVGRRVVPVMKSQHPELAAVIDVLDVSKIGATLLATWGLPERVVEAIEHQHDPDFLAPDDIAPEYRNEVAILYLSRVCAELLMAQGGSVAATADYLAALGIREKADVDFYRAHVLPAIRKQSRQLPDSIRQQLGAEFSAEPQPGVASALAGV